jgi:hypothetical protein
MRELANAERIRSFMRAFGRAAAMPGRVLFTGGATAVLLGWRESTIDVDIKLVPDQDALLRSIPALKESLHLNVELASPDDFIPVRDGWLDRSPFIGQEGRLTFQHFELVAQALAKIERGHAQDLADVRTMLERGLVSAGQILDEFRAIEGQLYRYPAVDPAAFARAINDVVNA